MLSQAESIMCPKLESFRTVRIKFCKTGNLQYISHLDLQRTISRVLVRAGIPMWYTQGFNPHPKIIFGLPLSVGAESLCEYLDLRIDRDMPSEEIRRRLNRALTEEMCVLDAYNVPEKSVFGDIVWARYDIRIRQDGITKELAKQVEKYLTTSPLMMDKKSKSGVRQVDITTLTRSLSASVNEEENELRIDAVLSVAGADYLNPDYLLRALSHAFGLAKPENMSASTRILRTKVYLADGETEFR